MMGSVTYSQRRTVYRNFINYEHLILGEISPENLQAIQLKNLSQFEYLYELFAYETIINQNCGKGECWEVNYGRSPGNGNWETLKPIERKQSEKMAGIKGATLKLFKKLIKDIARDPIARLNRNGKETFSNFNCVARKVFIKLNFSRRLCESATAEKWIAANES